MPLLQKFLNALPPTASDVELEKLANADQLSFQVDEVYSDVPDVGLVISGIMKRCAISSSHI